MASPPTIEWRDSSSPYAVLTGIAFSGSGYAGAIPVGTISSQVVVRLYNNFAGASGIADAYNCVLAVYDDPIHQGVGITPATTGKYLQVEVTDYNGVTTGGDTLFYALGAQTKHPMPVNGGILSGSGANYATIVMQVAVPATATQGSITQGVWLEYSASV